MGGVGDKVGFLVMNVESSMVSFISHKYQRLNSQPRFTHECAVALTHRNHCYHFPEGTA